MDIRLFDAGLQADALLAAQAVAEGSGVDRGRQRVALAAAGLGAQQLIAPGIGHAFDIELYAFLAVAQIGDAAVSGADGQDEAGVFGIAQLDGT